MASGKMLHYMYPRSNTVSTTITSADNLLELELEESDVWNHVGPTESKKITIPSFRPAAMEAASLPVGVPDWSKILKDQYMLDNRRRDSVDDDEDEDDDGDRVPPHVYLARTRGASLSVHEGIGRTLKGRDLRRVRNAIWKKVGFED